jgi:hypothetical protein
MKIRLFIAGAILLLSSCVDEGYVYGPYEGPYYGDFGPYYLDVWPHYDTDIVIKGRHYRNHAGGHRFFGQNFGQRHFAPGHNFAGYHTGGFRGGSVPSGGGFHGRGASHG